MDIKKHYKIIITILIVIILISSFTIYYHYKSTEKNINIKYSSSSYNYKFGYLDISKSFVIYSEHNLTSCMFINNNEYYLNTTFKGISITIYPGLITLICLSMNATWNYNKINNVKVDVSQEPYVYTKIFVRNSTLSIDKCYPGNIAVIPKNIANMHIEIKQCFESPADLDNYNLTVRTSLNNNFYNTYHINIVKETGIYGCIINPNNLTTDKVNTELLIENMNNSNYKIIHVINGYYYCFLKPYTEYKLYSIEKNNTLNFIHTISNLTTDKGYRIEIPSSSI